MTRQILEDMKHQINRWVIQINDCEQNGNIDGKPLSDQNIFEMGELRRKLELVVCHMVVRLDV